MSCTLGFDPFGERGERFSAHLTTCAYCRDAVKVLGSATATWKDEVLADSARAVFRERRLAMPRARRPLHTKGTSLAIFVAVAITSAWAFAQMTLHWRAPRAAMEPSEVSNAHASAPPALAPIPASSIDPTPPPSPPSPPRPSSAPPAPTAPTANELWDLGLARLEQGDRTGAGRLFERVIDAPRVDPELRHRAMFRLAEVKLAMRDAVTSRELLWEVVRARDATLGFDAALLLERAAPGERAQVWDAYLEANPDGPMRAQAVARRNARGGL